MYNTIENSNQNRKRKQQPNQIRKRKQQKRKKFNCLNGEKQIVIERN